MWQFCNSANNACELQIKIAYKLGNKGQAHVRPKLGRCCGRKMHEKKRQWQQRQKSEHFANFIKIRCRIWQAINSSFLRTFAAAAAAALLCTHTHTRAHIHTDMLTQRHLNTLNIFIFFARLLISAFNLHGFAIKFFWAHKWVRKYRKINK